MLLCYVVSYFWFDFGNCIYSKYSQCLYVCYYVIMLLNSIVLLVESLLPHKMVEKMAKFIKQDSFSRGIISKISTFQGKNGFGTNYSDRIVISPYSLDLANGKYNIPIHIPGIGYFRTTDNQTAYLVELEKIAYPLIERIVGYFSDLGAEVEYDGLVVKSDGFAQFGFDFLKDDAMLIDHEIDLTLEDFERSHVSGCVK